jgi:hypothetical protein
MHNDMLNWPPQPPRSTAGDDPARSAAALTTSATSSPMQRWIADYCGRSTIASCAVVVGLIAGSEQTEVLVEWPVAGEQNQPLIGSASAAFKRGQPLVIVPPVALPDAQFERIVALPLFPQYASSTTGSRSAARQQRPEHLARRPFDGQIDGCDAIAAIAGHLARPQPPAGQRARTGQ